ncbi:restriction endonuclease subunit S [Vibrio sp. 378]|uniref:restriction endonuclease subunit S n=1 Tax=Vibrionaceae TaxID=641 RepID=UPI002963CAF5|nr:MULTISPECIES: restriction endonuclease subunit S [Vibrionaceae]MDW2147337.1 restriction endonuclease subunit S [Vibrio sp. 378]
MSVDHSSIETMITQHIDTWTSAVKTKSASGRGSSKKLELYGVKKLRELILELAVRGKLVSQDPDDEPASVLLERIAVEKAQLVKDKKIKKQKSLGKVSDDEVLFDLPVGWEWTRLSELAEIGPRNNDVDDESEASFVPMPMITTSYKGEHSAEVRKWKDIKKGYTHFRDGDIALAKITPCFENSKAAVFSGLKNSIGSGTTELHVARPVQGTIDPLFVLLYLKAPMFLKVGETKMTGSAGQKRVPKDFFAGNPLPFPPLNEQHRIVSKVDELMTLCDQLEQQTEASIEAHQVLVSTLLDTLTNSADADELMQNWARISEHFDTLFTTEESIEQLKQTILQLAVMGKLVPQDPNDEPASVLLGRIVEEKAQLVKEKQIKNHPKVTPIGDVGDIPNSWERIVVQDFADIRLGSTPSRHEAKFWNGNIPWVSSGEVANNVIQDTAEKITEEGFNHSSTSIIPKRSLLMAIIGQGKTRGQTAILGIDACTNQNVAAFVFNEEYVIPEYVWVWAKSKYSSHRQDGHGGAQPALNGKKVRSFAFPLPPYSEQKRIVEQVDELTLICEQLKQRLRDSQRVQRQLADAIIALHVD